MAAPYQPQNVTAEQADGNILISWSGSLGATGYNIQRSPDGVNFTDLAAVGISTQYVDVLPGTGVMFWYQVAGTNGDGTGIYSSSAQMVAAPPSEMSLFELRLRSQQTADRVNSQFVTTSEWNAFIRLAMYELYDILITVYEDLFASDYVFVNTNGTEQRYPVPDGANNYFGDIYPSTSTDGAPAKALYKLAGMDLGVNTSNDAWVTLQRFDFIARNAYVYPNSTSTIYGVYNMRYRLMGNFINIIPTPSGNQQVRVWYSPKLPALLADVDLTTIGYSGWLRYPIDRPRREVRARQRRERHEQARCRARLPHEAHHRLGGQPRCQGTGASRTRSPRRDAGPSLRRLWLGRRRPRWLVTSRPNFRGTSRSRNGQRRSTLSWPIRSSAVG
jgi:hypothetical protein